MLSANEIRKKYLNFFKSKGHAIIPSASLIPENDPSLLFTNSGMSPLVPYLLGEKHPEGVCLANSQKCFRTEDIEEVGDNRHNTFFEMLGNWSLGDYFKEEQLNWWFEFIINELKLDINKIYQTVYAGDELVDKDINSIEILKKIYTKYGIDAQEGLETIQQGDLGPGVEIDFNKYRIFAYKDKNWWKRGDAVGELGGPDSETFYDTGKTHNPKFGQYCHLNCDCGRFLEIGNSVFMQYKKTASGWEELQNKNVDFGGGLERITMVSQNKDNIFQTDLFQPIIDEISQLSGKKYEENMSAFEIIADHIKAATLILGDNKGLTPSNTDQGYIIRRLIRRAVRYAKQIDITTIFTFKLAEKVIDIYIDIYPELKNNREFIFNQLIQEEEKFAKTLQKGIEEIDKIFNKYKGDYKEFSLDANTLFDLYQSYGFPIEMSLEEINKKRLENGGLEIEPEIKNKFLNLFQTELKKHQELSRQGSEHKFKGGLADTSEQTTRLHTAAHLMLAALKQVLGPQVMQKGSNITAERLRFDFNHDSKLTPEQIQLVEDIVNSKIKENLDITCVETTVAEAKEQGATGVFENKYGEKVKVYSAGDFSKEICGGPHVKNTGELGQFQIVKEESSSAGVRRIKAILD